MIVVIGSSLFFGCAKLLKQRADIKYPVFPTEAMYTESEACIVCHNDKVYGGIHSRIASFEAYGYKHGCEGCHGPGSLHIAGKGDREKILRFGKEGINANEVSGVCTFCYKKYESKNFFHIS